jgi:hypothetical protein
LSENAAVDDLQKQRLQGAVVGFNLTAIAYMLIRYMPLFFAGRNVGWDWYLPQLAIAIVVGLIGAGIGYGVMMAMQK